MRFGAFLLCFLLSCARPACAQHAEQFTSYGIDQGLPQVSVWSVAQDKAGFLWVGTSDGACRFDGYTFKVYRANAADPRSISGNLYFKFYTDRTGQLWIAARNAICRYNDLTDDFTTVYKPEDDRFSHGSYSVLGEDRENIWASFPNYGLIKINKTTLHTTLIPGTAYLRQSRYRMAQSGLVDGDLIWIGGSDTRCYVYRISTDRFISLAIPPVHEIANFNDSEVVATTTGGLMAIHKQRMTARLLPVTLPSPNVMKCLFRVSPTELLVGGDGGMYFINTRSWRIVRTITSFDAVRRNPYVSVRCAYRDGSGNLWIGMDGDGLKKLTAPYKPFSLYASARDSGQLVKSIYADSEHLYTGYANACLAVFNRRSGFAANIGTGHPRRQVAALARVDKTHLLFHIADKKVAYLLHLPSGRIRPALSGLETVLPDYEKNVNVSAFFYQSGDTVYSGFADCLLAFKASVTPVRPVLIHRFPNAPPNCAFRDSRAVLWCGSSGAVFYRWEGIWHRLLLSENALVKTINEDAEGHIWVGTINGLYIFDAAGHMLGHYTEANGLNNSFIYGILRDDDGNMWFSHNKGLTVYRRATRSFRHYTSKDGLQSNEFNTGAYFKAADGTLFFGGINGTNAFHPRAISDNPNRPAVRITDIQISDTPYKTDTAFWNIRALTLPHQKNSLSFEFSALEYTAPELNRYAYILEGADDAWIDAGTRRFARYTRLVPGQYTFKVKACNNDGLWGAPTAVSIIIVPPFWQRWWFRLALAALAAGILAVLLLQVQRARYRRTMRALELQQKIQLERERISRDLHDNVGTQLSLISNNLEWLEHPPKPLSQGETAEKLHFANTVSRDIIATLRETIWALKKETISLVEFSDRLKAFVQKQVAAHQHIGFGFSETFDGTLLLGPSEALNLFRICQEAIANALKHSGGSRIGISIQNSGATYQIAVTDDGVGFDPDAVNADIQNGLENMRHRAGEVGAELHLVRAAGGGTVVRVLKNSTDAV